MLCVVLLDHIACTTYVHAVYCYQPSSVVCQSGCQSVTLVSRAQTAKPIETQFGLGTQVGPEIHVNGRWGSRSPWEGAILMGEGASHCKV